MVNNSTNINKTNNLLSPHFTEHKNRPQQIYLTSHNKNFQVVVTFTIVRKLCRFILVLVLWLVFVSSDFSFM